MIVPVKGKVLIRKDEPKAKTASGIYLRPNDRAKSYTAEIISGSEVYPSGQRIIFIPRVSSSVNFRGENFLVISDDDILGTYD